MRYLIPVAVLLVATPAWATAPRNLTFEPGGALPSGWTHVTKPATAGRSYKAGASTSDAHNNKHGAFLLGVGVPPKDSYGAMQQTSDAVPYRGKRVRFSVWLRPTDVKRRAGLFLFADDAKGQPLVGDNTQDRITKGTGGWRQITIVQEIPQTATTLRYGAMLFGEGRLSVADVIFEPVGMTVPLTPNVVGAKARP
ncbi:MAG: Transcriptional regulator, AraC family [Cyanobacteria bacterium RYN_339]|nr:Transcriptional regulator, AraC family [Cyanobacteria bacterium RYN_339]